MLLFSVPGGSNVEDELDYLDPLYKKVSECSDELEDAVGLDSGEGLEISSIFKVMVSVSKRQQNEQC